MLFSRSVVYNLLQPHGLQHARPPCPSPAPGVYSDSCLLRRRQWHATPVLLPGKSHGRRSLVGCSPWGREESDTTEQLLFHFSLSCIGEGNGNPLQCSRLENPRDGGAWWAAVHGVVKSRTRLSDFTFMHWRRKWQPTPVFLPGESQEPGSPLGCRLWGLTDSDTTEAT